MLLFLALSWVGGGMPSARADLILTEADNATIVKMEAGQNLFIHLSGNPSTGFSWRMTSTNEDTVTVAGDVVYTPDSGLSGSGGVYSFPFRAVKPGEAVLSFVYGKSWDPQSTDKTFDVTIEVAGTAPGLSISLVGTKVVIAWPVSGSSGFYLEGTTSLSPPQWLALNTLPISDGTTNRVTLGTSGKSLFFRLRK